MSKPIITIMGAGKIGYAMAVLLKNVGDFDVRVVDQNAKNLEKLKTVGVETFQSTDVASMKKPIQGSYAVLNALPFFMAPDVAKLCVESKVHYFDLTEDVKSTHAIQALAPNADSVLMPQCGLAPGFIGITGNDFANRFDKLRNLQMRVGALPRFPGNALRYAMTWSTDGVINEYCNPCEAIVDGKTILTQPLEGLETFVLDGVEYEAFNTSGGLGTLAHSLQGKAENVDYKTIRYPGHCEILKLLLNELGLKHKRDVIGKIFEDALPNTDQDVIIIKVSANGMQNGRLMEETYSGRVFGSTIDGHTLNAIQLSTAAGICTALDLVRNGKLPQKGFLGQEQIKLSDFLANRFGKYYEQA